MKPVAFPALTEQFYIRIMLQYFEVKVERKGIEPSASGVGNDSRTNPAPK